MPPSRWRDQPEAVRGASREVKEAAGRMRRAPTAGEAALWEAIRRGGLDGLRFRRQHPVGRFVLDFYCPSHRLAVEVDGGVHASPEQADRDAARDAHLRAAGYRIVRVTNREVLHDLPAALSRISAAARAPLPGDAAAPAQTPPPGFGGGVRA